MTSPTAAATYCVRTNDSVSCKEIILSVMSVVKVSLGGVEHVPREPALTYGQWLACLALDRGS